VFAFFRKQGEDDKEVKIVAVDLQAMAPLPGVVQIQGDITKVILFDILSAVFKYKTVSSLLPYCIKSTFIVRQFRGLK